jgi:aspartate racemase
VAQREQIDPYPAGGRSKERQMKKIGIIGGLAWPSTVTYYRIINEETARRLGGNHCARLAVSQTDFDEVERSQAVGDWQHVGELLGAEANNLKAAGADFFIMACNTVHAAYPYIMRETDLPNIHIVDPTAGVIKARGFGTVGLIGSGYTMDGEFFKGRLREKYGLTVLVPEGDDRGSIHSALYSELVRGVVLPETREKFISAIDNLAVRGAQAIILGCTEFGLLLKPEDSPVPLIDTAAEHARAAAAMALED